MNYEDFWDKQIIQAQKCRYLSRKTQNTIKNQDRINNLPKLSSLNIDPYLTP